MSRKYRDLPNWWSAADFFLRESGSTGSTAKSEEATQVLYIVIRTHNLDLGTPLYRDLIHIYAAKTSNPSPTRSPRYQDNGTNQGTWFEFDIYQGHHGLIRIYNIDYFKRKEEDRTTLRKHSNWLSGHQGTVRHWGGYLLHQWEVVQTDTHLQSPGIDPLSDRPGDHKRQRKLPRSQRSLHDDDEDSRKKHNAQDLCGKRFIRTSHTGSGLHPSTSA